MLFRLKLGTFVQGSSRKGNLKIFKHNDPNGEFSEGNIIESDEDLAALEPLKFEYFHGQKPKKSTLQKAGTLPPDEVDREEARDSEPMTSDEMEERANRLIERAATMRQRAQESKKTASSATSSQESEGKESPPVRGGQKSPGSEKEYHATVDKMSLSDLRSHAKERGIDLKGATTREDMAKTIKTHKE